MNVYTQHPTPAGLPIHSTPISEARPKAKAKDYLFDALVGTAITGLFLGVSDIFGSGSFSGLCLAIGAIFYGLALIVKFIHKTEEAANG
jgi:hypothetical protein